MHVLYVCIANEYPQKRSEYGWIDGRMVVLV